MMKTMNLSEKGGSVYIADRKALACVAKDWALDEGSKMASVPEIMERGFRNGAPEKVTMFADSAGVGYARGWARFDAATKEVRYVSSKAELSGAEWYRRIFVQHDVPAGLDLPVIVMVIRYPGTDAPDHLALLNVQHPDMEDWVAKTDIAAGEERR